MRSRVHGESKLSLSVVWDFLLLLAHKLSGRTIPARFISFAAVGLSGVAVHMLVLGTLHRFLGMAFLVSQTAATGVAMTSNFFLNNRLTWPERRLRGSAVIRGLLSFYLACAFGALVNVALADWLALRGFPWWGAGLLGVVAGAVWNYGSTGVLTWREPSR
jgi:dolichol-phosphate mannosyltransferase